MGPFPPQLLHFSVCIYITPVDPKLFFLPILGAIFLLQVNDVTESSPSRAEVHLTFPHPESLVVGCDSR